jgi:hypothetical protein
VSTHVHDTIHDANTLGVDIPSVPETQFRRSIVLPGIPNDSRYRVLLRIYGYGSNAAVIVRTRDAAAGFLLDEKTVAMNGSAPSYVQMPIGAAPTSASVRVEVTTANAIDPPIWGFITLTNNVTENVTTITPNTGIAPTVPAAVTLAKGHWGHAGFCMTVSSLVINVTYTCEFGSFPPPVIDPDGHFEVDGTYIPVGGAFPKQGSSQQGVAHYSGLVRGTNLTLVIRTESGSLGPLALQFGSTDPCFGLGCP